MNKLLNELSQKAEDYADDTDLPWLATYTEKLAELIIRECARIAITKQTENDIANIVSENPAKDFAYALVEHFGVE